MRRVVVTGGGTGGHLFPGIAVATALQREPEGARILFITPGRPLEQAALSRYAFRVASIRCFGLKGMGLPARLRALLQLPRALTQALCLVRRFRPHLVFGVGGYVTGPVLLAARMLRIPVCIHEQNAVPGLANRLAARLADRVLLSLECPGYFRGCSTVLTGNPVRQEIIAASRRPACRRDSKPVLLILGGSQGARPLNRLLMAAVQSGAWSTQARIIHQTGAQDASAVQRLYRERGISCEVKPFFDNMADRYRQADLVISRAGATTLAELAVMGLPALLIPYPHAADNHQEKNGATYVQAGGALLFRQQTLEPAQLAQVVTGLLSDRQQLEKMSRAMRRQGKPEATRQILREFAGIWLDNRTVHV